MVATMPMVVDGGAPSAGGATTSKMVVVMTMPMEVGCQRNKNQLCLRATATGRRDPVRQPRAFGDQIAPEVAPEVERELRDPTLVASNRVVSASPGKFWGDLQAQRLRLARHHENALPDPPAPHQPGI